jgi:hypothetical protein
MSPRLLLPRRGIPPLAHHLVCDREIIAGHHETHKNLPQLAIGGELAEFHNIGGPPVHGH